MIQPNLQSYNLENNPGKDINKYLSGLKSFLGPDSFGHPKPDSRRLMMEMLRILKLRLSTINSAIEATIKKNSSNSANKEKDDVEDMIK